MSIFNRFFKRKPKASLDSVSFDVTRYRFGGDDDGQRVWFTPDGDGIGLFFFPKRPDLPTQARTSLELEEFYRGRVCNDAVKMVEFRLSPVLGINSIWMILKTPQEFHGMTYLGSLTVPFADFSFVIKMLCEEQGITGIREATLMLKAQQEGTVTIADDGKVSGDWCPDNERYDTMFPDHPISRLRREFASVMATLQIEKTTRNEKPFELPRPGSGSAQA